MRPSRGETMLKIASTIAERSTCARRKVGCVLVDINGRVLSMGHNGVAKGQVHCIDTPCPGANCPTGTGLEKCEAIHAEANALMCSSLSPYEQRLWFTMRPLVTIWGVTSLTR